MWLRRFKYISHGLFETRTHWIQFRSPIWRASKDPETQGHFVTWADED